MATMRGGERGVGQHTIPAGAYAAPAWLVTLRRYVALSRSIHRIKTVKPVRWARKLTRRCIVHLRPAPARFDPTTIDHFKNVTVPGSVCGTLAISLFDGETPSLNRARSNPLTHRHVWVRNSRYTDMEDNDLRGFLDGRFKFCWNQASQIHVRIGRTHAHSALGEFELFRFLQRWAGISLPAGARIRRARLELEIERAVDHPLELFVYQVHHDWNPGHGGQDRNNNSAPVHGEVWWNEVAHGIQSWGLPGAGFASDSHPAADTPAMPLARVAYRPGDAHLVFESPELAAYIEERSRTGLPLLFLFKLADYLEDIPGSLLQVLSANHGDSQCDQRRPRLVVEWESAKETSQVTQECMIEHGRSLTLPRMKSLGAHSLAVGFQPQPGSEPPTLWVRGGLDENTSSGWLKIHHPVDIDWSWFQLRIEARVNPLALGKVFEATCRDTWVTTGPKESQLVHWTFTSPSGRVYSVLADYIGDSTWQVRFAPLELGRWRYQWTQNFIDVPYQSPEGLFDVQSSDPAQISLGLQKLAGQAARSGVPPGERRVVLLGVLFNRLQRALMQIQTPDHYGNSGGDVSQALDPLRSALSGQTLEQPSRAGSSPSAPKQLHSSPRS
jgi:hypothetical protein